jgi:uncharacterized membrane protein
MTTRRIEAFSDGVFAIAITLLILEMKVPHLDHGAGTDQAFDLSAALLHLWPSYFAYIFSFVMIGIYWANHHYIFRLYQKSDHAFILLNLFFLMCISFLPFPTAVLAAYITDARQQGPAITFYALGLFLPALAWLLVWLYASRGYRLLDGALDQRFVSHLTRQYIVSNALYLIAVGLSRWHGKAGLALCVGLTLLYLLPSKPPVYRDTAKRQSAEALEPVAGEVALPPGG